MQWRSYLFPERLYGHPLYETAYTLSEEINPI